MKLKATSFSFPQLILSCLLSTSCLQSSKFSPGGANNSLTIDDNFNSGGVSNGGNTNNNTPVSTAPSSETIGKIDLMSEDDLLLALNNEMPTTDVNNLKVPLLNSLQLDLSGTGYVPSITKEDIQGHLTIKFNNTELKKLILNELDDMELLSNVPLCTTTCTLKLSPGYDVDNLKTSLLGLPGILSVTFVYRLTAAAENRIRGEAAPLIAARNEALKATADANKAEAALVNQYINPNLRSIVYKYVSNTNKLHLYSNNPYVTGYDSRTDAFRAYNGNPPSSAVPIYKHVHSTTGRHAYRQSSNLGGSWSNKGIAFYAFSGFRDFGNIGIRVKTIPVRELSRNFTVDGKTVTTLTYIPDRTYPRAENETLVTFSENGWTVGSVVFWVPVAY